MTLVEVIQGLNVLDGESTIYAVKPWTEQSNAIVIEESIGARDEAEKLGMEYFLEVFIAHDFIEDWTASLDSLPSNRQKSLRLIEYATHDA